MAFHHLFSITKTRRHRDTFVRRLNIDVGEHVYVEEPISRSDEKKIEATILQLPSETMGDIFKLSQLVTYNHSDEKYEDSDWCWLTVTHVCKYWREIAVGTQELWADIQIEKHANLDQTKVYLERSGTSPLSVYYDSNAWTQNRYASQCFDSAIHHIHRIRELRIWNVRHLGSLFKLFSHPAPELEIFSFETDSRKEVNIKSLFEGRAPNLTSLTLKVYSSSWDHIPIFSNLRRLRISCPVSLQDILSIISNNPNYEELWISPLLKTGRPLDIPQIQPRYELRSLKNLVLKEASQIVLSQLFKSVDLPAESGWEIFCRDFPFKTTQLDPKVVIPPTSYGDFPILKLNISKDSVGISSKSHNAAENTFPLQRSVSYMWSGHHRLLPGQRATIGDGFDFVASVIQGEFWCSGKELTIEVISSCAEDLRSENIGGEIWKSLLKLLPDLCKLTVKHVWSRNSIEVVRTELHYGILNALASPIKTNDGSDVICPKLSELYLCGFNLQKYEEIKCTLESLKYRNRCGDGLSLLRITNLPRNGWSDANLRLLKGSGVARTIEVIV